MQDRTSRKQQRRLRELAQRRADIIAGAIEVFSAKGYDGAQMTEIAAAADLSLGSLYATFKGKEDVFKEVLQRGAKESFETIRSETEGIEDPAKRILCLIDALFACFERRRGVFQILISGTNGIPWRARAKWENAYGKIRGSFTAWLTEMVGQAAQAGYLPGIDPKAFAYMLIGAVMYAASRSIEEHPARPLTEQALELKLIFARILGSKEMV